MRKNIKCFTGGGRLVEVKNKVMVEAEVLELNMDQGLIYIKQDINSEVLNSANIYLIFILQVYQG